MLLADCHLRLSSLHYLCVPARLPLDYALTSFKLLELEVLCAFAELVFGFKFTAALGRLSDGCARSVKWSSFQHSQPYPFLLTCSWSLLLVGMDGGLNQVA